MRLTAHIKEATDGRLSLSVHEIPALEVQARNVEEIAEAVQQAAARHTGRKEDDFDVEPRHIPFVVQPASMTIMEGAGWPVR